MTRYIISRLLAAIPTLLGVTIVLFLALRILPGDPVSVILSQAEATTSPEVIAQLRSDLGLDQPLWMQYLYFLGSIFTFELGTSYATRQSVGSMIAPQIGPTIQLALAAVLVSAVVGILLGALAAVYRNSWIDAIVRVFSIVFAAMPNFWLGLLLIMLFSFTFQLFPATGTDGFAALVLPAVTLGLSASGVVARVVRNSLIETLGDQFVLALHAKGIRPHIVVLKHVLRNAIIPAVTVLGVQAGTLVAGAVIVEVVFARRGLGQLLVQAVANNDFAVIQGVVLVVAFVYVSVNIIVDVSYAYIDPRTRKSVTGAV